MVKNKKVNMADENAEKVFNELFNSLYPRLSSYSFKYVKDKYAAEEIVQDCMLNLWEKRHNINKIIDVKSYMYTVVRNASFSYLKKKNIIIPLEEKHYNSRDSLYPDIIEEEVHAVLIKALDTLPKKCRQVFELSCLAGLKYKEIAEEMDVSLSTVKSHRAHAVKILKRELKDHPLLFFMLFR